MASLNKVLIIGNLGRDPETRFATEGGLQITTINVATSRSYRSQASGQLVEETEWHRIVFFGKQRQKPFKNILERALPFTLKED